MSSKQPGSLEDERGAPPRAPQRVMQTIAELAVSPDGLSLTQLSERLQLPKTSLFSLLRSLEAGGYIVSENGHHRLGQETYSLAAIIQKNDNFPGNVHPALAKLHQECEETVMIGVLAEDRQQLVYVDVIEASAWLRFSANVGARRPLYSTSLGLVLLAYGSQAHLRDYLKTAALKPVTVHTLTSKKAVTDELKSIRQRGHVVSNGSVEGATGISAPIFNASADVVAAVGLAGPTARCERNTRRFVELVMAAGEQMSRILGYAGTYPRHPA